MEEVDEGLGLHGNGSSRPRGLHGRSGSNRVLLDDSISSECALSTKYERLSPSVRSPADESPSRQQRTAGVWRLLSFVPSAGKAVDMSERASGDDKRSPEQGFAPTAMEKNVELEEVSSIATSSTSRDEAKEEEDEDAKKKKKKTKKRSSWLPDPEKRWPIQGW